MEDESSVFGFELLQEVYGNKVAKKEDILILFVHWYLVKNGFRCIGINDSKAFEPSEKGSQLLPEDWNTRPNYAFRYVNNSKLFIFHGIKSDKDLLINLLEMYGENVTSVQFRINETVNKLRGPLKTIIPSYENVMKQVQKDLLDPFISGSTAENATQTSTINYPSTDDPSSYDPLRADPLRVGQWPRPSFASRPWNPEADPRNVGAADLNPFARGGGGMIFDPFAPSRNPIVDPTRPALGVPGRLPPGAVPPFARFDPFGPPDITQPRPRRDPDNDHLPPPGYNDMFM